MLNLTTIKSKLNTNTIAKLVNEVTEISNIWDEVMCASQQSVIQQLGKVGYVTYMGGVIALSAYVNHKFITTPLRNKGFVKTAKLAHIYSLYGTTYATSLVFKTVMKAK